MKASDLRSMSLVELNNELISLLKAQFGIKMQLSTQQLTNTQQLKQVRRDVARVKTVITQKLTKDD